MTGKKGRGLAMERELAERYAEWAKAEWAKGVNSNVTYWVEDIEDTEETKP
jgi:hypothetical protein